MATKRWIGNAAGVYDLWTIALSGAVISQTYSMTINGKSLTYVAGGADTVTIILTALQAAWANVSLLPPPEFNELTAVALPIAGPFTTITLTGKTLGKPSTISVATTGAATFTITNTTPATGPSDFANAGNWSSVTVPVNADVLVFDNGSIPCKYNLSTVLTGITVYVEPGYSGSIGLPYLNADGTPIYNEYRTTHLTLAGGTVVINSPSITRCNLAFGANTSTVRVLNTGSRPDQYIPVVLITGGNVSSELDMTKGDVGLAVYQGTTATFPTIKTSSLLNAQGDVVLLCGLGSVLTAIVKDGGNYTIRANVTTFTQELDGGITTITDTAAVTTLNAQNGTVNYNSNGTLGTATVSNKGILTFDQDPRAVTVTNPIQMYGKDAQLIDNQKRVNAGVLSFKSNQTTALNVQHGSDNTGSLT